MNETRNTSNSGRTATGHAGQDSAKFGFERRGGDADWAAAAQLENNTPVIPELTEGRCGVDGLPAGNCAHFPGPQVVTDPVTGETAYEEGFGEVPAHARPEHGARAQDREHATQEKAAEKRGA